MTPPTTASPAPVNTPAGTTKPRKVALVASIASNLPEPLSTGGQGIDKLGALLLGGLLYIGTRRLARRIIKAKAT
jgi:hypothetical protein